MTRRAGPAPMPELPEVEVTRLGLAAHMIGRALRRVDVLSPRLRWPVPEDLDRRLRGARVLALRRRAKYLLIDCDVGALLVHLGMSGSLRIAPGSRALDRHDRVVFGLSDGNELRFRDPRRFGSVLWAGAEPHRHPLLARLGVEPLDSAFSGEFLHARSRGRRLAVKSMLMDARCVAGVGNIYATEALHVAGIHPARAAGRIGRRRYDALAEAVRTTLRQAIDSGGTSLRDFVREDGRPGYFGVSLRAYGRAGQPCCGCERALRQMRIAQRSTVYCAACQT